MRRDDRICSNVWFSYSTFQAIANSSSVDAPFEDVGSSLSPWGTSRATARRLRRTRQKLGSYRHDLVVAMRLVNSVEAEMLRSEWENWLLDENSRCEKVSIALRESSSRTSDRRTDSMKAQLAQKVLLGGGDNDAKESAERTEILSRWYEEYCGSCRSDHDAVIRGREGLSMASI